MTRRAPDVSDRRLGALMGAAVGDALGVTFEFMPAEEIPPARFRMVGGGPFRFGPGEASDDTDLLCAVLRAYRDRNRFDARRAVANMVEWLGRDPPDVGDRTRAALSDWRDGVEPADNEDAQGNGGLMRAPAHALACDDGDAAAEFAGADTRLTHPSTAAADCSAFYAAALWWMLGGANVDEARRRAGEIAPGFPPYDTAVRSLGGHCVHSLRLALWAVETALTFEGGIDAVIRTGGDTDTNAAIAGALLGARFGLSALPGDWLNGLA